MLRGRMTLDERAQRAARMVFVTFHQHPSGKVRALANALRANGLDPALPRDRDAVERAFSDVLRDQIGGRS